MKVKLFAVFASLLVSVTIHAAVPLRWTVETSRAVPAQFEAYKGETLDLEAALQSYGKPLAAPVSYSLYWQTNGMGNAWWSSNCTTNYHLPSTNLLRATWTPSMETGARVYNCFIGQPGTIYHAAFQLRLRPSPGATPNELPLPQKVIDFAKVTVLNPPWSGGGGGVNTNAVIDLIHKTVDGSARYTPKYLWVYDCSDSYPDDAAEYYRSRGNGKTDGGCSAVREGGYLCRNFDYPFDERAEFVVRMQAGKYRFASVGVAQVGTNLTEAIVTSGKPEYSKFYKWLPGATVDGINENGVSCNINVVDGDPQASGWHTTGDLHPLGAIRWILDHATNAEHAATYIAANIRFPQGWSQNFHYMVADANSTYIVENGTAYQGGSGVSPLALTNFRLYPTRDTTGEGQERYDALASGASITSQWWTLTYTPDGYRASDLPGITGEDLANLFNYWENNPRESHRGETFGNKSWWQSVHTSVYDITNRTLRICVQETDDWYTFTVPAASSSRGVDAQAVRDIVDASFDGGTNAVNISLTNSYTKAETDELLADKADINDLSGKLDTVNPSPGQDWHSVVWGDDGRLQVVGGLSSTSIETLGITGLQGLTLDGASQPPGHANWNLIAIKIGNESHIFLQDALDLKQDALPYPTNAIPASVISGLEPPTSPILRVYDEVRQCWWIGRMVNGVINWEVE